MVLALHYSSFILRISHWLAFIFGMMGDDKKYNNPISVRFRPETRRMAEQIATATGLSQNTIYEWGANAYCRMILRSNMEIKSPFELTIKSPQPFEVDYLKDAQAPRAPEPD